MRLRTSDLIGKTPEEKQVIIAAFIAARPKERTATMSEPTKLSEEERDDLASVHARLVELGPALYGDSVPYQQRLIEHIWATDDELAAQAEEIRQWKAAAESEALFANEASDAIDERDAEIRRLREALEPLVRNWHRVDSEVLPGDGVCLCLTSAVCSDISVEDFRRAAKAME